MPQGKGTYGSKKGRPPKKRMGYAKGAMICGASNPPARPVKRMKK